MAARVDNRYSRFVVWAKIILPLIGLAILSSLFLFSRSYETGNPAGLFDGDIADFANKERISGPRFAGSTQSGAAIQLSADEASPSVSTPGAFDAHRLTAEIEFPDGQALGVTAESGFVDSINKTAVLSGGIVLTTSYGYVAKSDGMTFALDRLDIRSKGEITATGPLGMITAGQLIMRQDGTNPVDGSPEYVLIFKNRVKLIYKPD